eukprot:11359120-Alexandrium_andersonii.AAC.1
MLIVLDGLRARVHHRLRQQLLLLSQHAPEKSVGPEVASWRHAAPAERPRSGADPDEHARPRRGG